MFNRAFLYLMSRASEEMIIHICLHIKKEKYSFKINIIKNSRERRPRRSVNRAENPHDY